MGNTRTPVYRVEFKNDHGKVVTPASWDVKGINGKGKPNAENLKKYVDAMNSSFEPGGVNEHCGIDTKVSEAVIVRQKDDTVVAVYTVSGKIPYKP
jgi:hypothetical protein